MKGLLTYQLKPEELELRFRTGRLSQDKIQVMIIVVLTALIDVGFIALDYQLFQSGFILHTSITSRLVIVITSFLVVWLIPRQSIVKSFDRIVFVWGMLVVTHMMIVSAVRPADYVTLVAWDILVIFALYTAVPTPLKFQILIAFFLTIGSGVLWLAIKVTPWHPLETVSILAAYSFSNVFGIMISKRFNLSRRQQFFTLMQEREAKEALEKTLLEVKVLRGILPICASCKKIRDDKGYWNQIEAYLSKHTEADFSHGICPDCAEKLYSDLYRDR